MAVAEVSACDSVLRVCMAGSSGSSSPLEGGGLTCATAVARCKEQAGRFPGATAVWPSGAYSPYPQSEVGFNNHYQNWPLYSGANGLHSSRSARSNYASYGSYG
jgi:hypothetical protein